MPLIQKKSLLCNENLRDNTYLEDLLAEGERVGDPQARDVCQR